MVEHCCHLNMLYAARKSQVLKEQEFKGLLSSLGFKTLLSNVPLFGKIFFYFF